MSELTESNEGDQKTAGRQSGMQIWIASALFIIIPTLLILAIKLLFGV